MEQLTIKEIADKFFEEAEKLNVSYDSREAFIEGYKQAKEMEKEQKGYSEENVRDMLFMALYEPQEECCTTHTKDSIVRKVLKTFKSE